MFKTRDSLTSLLTGAGVAMVALTGLATVMLMVVVQTNPIGSLSNFFVMTACSSISTIFVFSNLHFELKSWERKAFTEARTDPLSGLPNRKAVIEALNRMISNFGRDGAASYFAIFDLNNFKNVNDTLGHEMGDELLAQVAERLRTLFPPHHIFRLGGDEFALLFEQCKLSEAEDKCRRLHNNIAGSYMLGETFAGIGCSLGLAQVEDGLTASDLMRRADHAMYKAKKSRTFIETFDQNMLQELERKSELTSRLRSSLVDGVGISLKYQPIFSREKDIVALEVYFRWYDNELGEVPPREAVQIARLTQQIDSLSLFVAGEAIKLMKQVHGIKMCINVEAMQILDTRFAEALEKLIIANGMRSSSFQLEIDESEIVAYSTKVMSVLRGLADSGFTIAVDNYGSSTSSLTELHSMGVTAIKLDNSLLHNARDTKSISILRAKVHLASTLGIKVTCKGICDQEDESIALQSGCDFLQGFRYGRPDCAGSFLDQSEKLAMIVNG